MKSETYFYRMKVVSPLHVGCGEVYEPTGFVVDEGSRQLLAFETVDFLASMEKDELEKYSRICRRGTTSSLLEIYKFINRNKGIIRGERIGVSSAFVNHYNKVLRLKDKYIEQELNNFLINRTAFEPLFTRPYIPGSAIKGALRTAVLNSRNNGSSHSPANLQQELLDYQQRNMETDPFRLIKVSDFQLLGEGKREIVYAVNGKKKPSDREAGGPYQILEVIEPGAEFIGTITVQPHIGAGIQRAVSLEELEKSLSFYKGEMKRENRELAVIGCRADLLEKLRKDNASRLIRIGRHCGAESVTVAGQREIKIKGKGNSFKTLDHATTLWLAADSDKPGSNQGLRPFGWLSLSLLDADERAENKSRKQAYFSSWQDKQQKKVELHHRKTEEIARLREEEERERKRIEEEKRRREEEIAEYPWREFLPALLARIDNWGSLKTMILESGKVKQYQCEPEVGEAVKEVAVDLAKKTAAKWDQERDSVVGKWLEASKTVWTSQVSSAGKPQEPVYDSDLLARINACQSYADFNAEKITVSKLDEKCADALKVKFNSWKLKKSKNKREQKKFAALVKRLKTFAR